MKLKKLLAALLCLCMLLSMLAACTETPEDGDDKTEESSASENGDGNEDVKVTLGDYRIVYPKGASGSVRDAVATLEKAMTDLGLTVTVVTDAENDIANPDREILVGATNRVASKTYLEEAESNAYTVRAAGNKIVLCGGVDLLTDMAVDEFIATYVNAASLSELKIESAINKTVDLSVKFVENGASEYSIVYDKNLTYLKEQVKEQQSTVSKATGVSMS